MKYTLTKSANVPKKEKFDIKLDVYPNVERSGIVHVTTKTGHNQEFYDKQSMFTYIVLDGGGTFYLDDEQVAVSAGDILTIRPQTRIYYKGKFNMILITTPPWQPENEVETRHSIW